MSNYTLTIDTGGPGLNPIQWEKIYLAYYVFFIGEMEWQLTACEPRHLMAFSDVAL